MVHLPKCLWLNRLQVRDLNILRLCMLWRGYCLVYSKRIWIIIFLLVRLRAILLLSMVLKAFAWLIVLRGSLVVLILGGIFLFFIFIQIKCLSLLFMASLCIVVIIVTWEKQPFLELLTWLELFILLWYYSIKLPYFELIFICVKLAGVWVTC